MSKSSRDSKESTPVPVPIPAAPIMPTAAAAPVVVPVEDNNKRPADTAPPVERKKLVKEQSIESDNSAETEKKMPVKKEKGPAPPPPSQVMAQTVAVSLIPSPPPPPPPPPPLSTSAVQLRTQHISESSVDSADMATTTRLSLVKEDAEDKSLVDYVPGLVPPPPQFMADQPFRSMEPDSLNKDDSLSRISDDLETKSLDSEIKHELSNIISVVSPMGIISRSNSTEDELSSRHSSPAPIVSVTSTPVKANTSTITINADTPDPSNSLSSNVSQVTVVTSHPPVIVDNSVRISAVDKTMPNDSVVIVSNKTNRTTHINESSTDDEYPSLDSLEFTPKQRAIRQGTILIGDTSASKHLHAQRARKLDESEVFIVVEDDSELIDDSNSAAHASTLDSNNSKNLDTSHVSVVTVGEEISVKDSSNIRRSDRPASAAIISTSTPTNNMHQRSDDVRKLVLAKNKMNGQINKSSSGDDVSIIVNKKKTNPLEKRISPDSSVGSMDSRTHSECGSMRSSGAPSAITHKIDRSDAESIATTTSHDSREPVDEEVIIRRPKPETPKTPRTKEEIEMRNLRKKTRKRTRKFEIDGVQVTTTTSKVIYGDDDNGRLYDDHIFRKQELRELKMLQKQEKKQFLDLQTKEMAAREQQEKRFELERTALERTYDSDMDTLARQHRQLVEKTEQQQESDLRMTSKKIRGEQERELKLVHDQSV